MAVDAGFVSGLMRDFSKSQIEMRQRKQREDLLKKQQEFQEYQKSEAARTRYLNALQKIVEGDYPGQTKALAAQYYGEAASSDKWSEGDGKKQFAEIMDSSIREVETPQPPQIQAAQNKLKEMGGGDQQQGAQMAAQAGDVLPQLGVMAAGQMSPVPGMGAGGFAESLMAGLQGLGGQAEQLAQTPEPQTQQISGPLRSWELAAQEAQRQQILNDAEFEQFRRKTDYTQSLQPEWRSVGFDPSTGQIIEENTRTGERRAQQMDGFTPAPKAPIVQGVGDGKVIEYQINPETGEYERTIVNTGVGEQPTGGFDLGKILNIPGLEGLMGKSISDVNTALTVRDKLQNIESQSPEHLYLMNKAGLTSMEEIHKSGQDKYNAVLKLHSENRTAPVNKERLEKAGQFLSARAAIGEAEKAFANYAKALASGNNAEITTAFQQYHTAVNGMAITVGRAMGEVGVFTDQDVQRYKDLFALGKFESALAYVERRLAGENEESAWNSVKPGFFDGDNIDPMMEAMNNGEFGHVMQMGKQRLDRTRQLFSAIEGTAFGGTGNVVMDQMQTGLKEFYGGEIPTGAGPISPSGGGGEPTIDSLLNELLAEGGE